MFDPERSVSAVVKMVLVLVVLVVGLIGISTTQCQKKSPPATYELNISDEDGFHLSVPKD